MVWAKVVTVMRWYAHDKVNQEESEQNKVDGMKKGADSTGEVMHSKERLVICNEDHTDGRAIVTADDERVLHVDWTEIRLCR